MLRIYVPVNPLWSCWVRSVYLTTLFLGQVWSSKLLTSTCAHSFARNWQLPFLKQWKVENDHRKYFMINLHERMLTDLGGSNLWPSDHQLDVHPTKLPRPANLTLLSLNMTCQVLANRADPDQLASEEANWSGSALFVIKYVNFYQKPGSSNLIGWKSEVGMAS